MSPVWNSTPPTQQVLNHAHVVDLDSVKTYSQQRSFSLYLDLYTCAFSLQRTANSWSANARESLDLRTSSHRALPYRCWALVATWLATPSEYRAVPICQDHHGTINALRLRSVARTVAK
jgi:hypothetical protein